MASGWNLWVWLKCIGVVSYNIIVDAVVRRYIDFLIIIIITYPYNYTPLALALFAAASLLFIHYLKKCIFLLF